MADIDLTVALDWLSRSLAVLVSLVGLVVAVNQFTLPSILRGREKWLRETLAAETNEHRRVLLQAQLIRTTARLVGRLLLPARRYAEIMFWLILTPVQAYLWTFNSPNWLSAVNTIAFSVVFLGNAIRRGIRLLAERFRVVHEYEAGSQTIRPPRTGMLAQMEGGTRKEFRFGFLLALFANLTSVGVALIFANQIAWGIGIGIGGLAGVIVLVRLIHGYVVSRRTIFGPWPKDHNVDDPRD